jgi:hypothetical protein
MDEDERVGTVKGLLFNHVSTHSQRHIRDASRDDENRQIVLTIGGLSCRTSLAP